MSFSVILKNIYILCFLLKMVLIAFLSILDIIYDFVLVRKSLREALPHQNAVINDV